MYLTHQSDILSGLVDFALMIRFKAEKFLNLIKRLEVAIQVIGTADRTYSKAQVPARVAEDFRQIENDCRELQLALSADQASRIVTLLTVGDVRTAHQLKQAFTEMQNRLYDEMSHVIFFRIPQEKIEYYADGETIFGSDIIAAFPSALKDIEEAGKCFACGRNTACVFHLMRVVEVGLNAVGRELGISVVVDTWNKVLRDIKSELRRLENLPGNPEKDKIKFLTSVHERLDSIRIAWRNDTMHIVTSYDEESARDVMVSTKAFMRRLSQQVKE